MIKKILITITAAVSIALFSACSYFLPMEVNYKTPELQESEKVVMPSMQIRRGDLMMMYDLGGTFVPEPTKLFIGEAKVNGSVHDIYFSIGEEVKEGDLIVELNTDSITDKIHVQNINVEKIRLTHEQNLVLYETGKIDRYTLELSALTLEAAENYLSDLEEDLSLHYIYAPADGVLVYLNHDVGDYAFGEVFGVSKIEDGIIEILISSSRDMSDGQIEMIGLEIGDQAIIIFEGVEYEAELIRDYSSYHIEFGFDPEWNHIQFRCSEIPDDIGFNRSAIVRNITEQALGAVVIPVSAVYLPESTPYTYVLNGEEIEKRFIELGMSDGLFYEVLDGLQEGEQIFIIK